MTAGDDDRAARFRACFDACAPAITRYARRRLAPDDAADLVADCFTVAWRRLDEVLTLAAREVAFAGTVIAVAAQWAEVLG